MTVSKLKIYLLEHIVEEVVCLMQYGPAHQLLRFLRYWNVPEPTLLLLKPPGRYHKLFELVP